MIMDERTRIQFLIDRYGEEAAKLWAEQTLAIYESAALKESKYHDSILSLRAFLGEWSRQMSKGDKHE